MALYVKLTLNANAGFMIIFLSNVYEIPLIM